MRLIHTIFARGRKLHLPREGDVVLTGCSEWEEKLEKTGGCAACCQLPAASLGWDVRIDQSPDVSVPQYQLTVAFGTALRTGRENAETTVKRSNVSCGALLLGEILRMHFPALRNFPNAIRYRRRGREARKALGREHERAVAGSGAPPVQRPGPACSEQRQEQAPGRAPRRPRGATFEI